MGELIIFSDLCEIFIWVFNSLGVLLGEWVINWGGVGVEGLFRGSCFDIV